MKSKIQQLAKTDFGIAIIITVLWKILIVTVGYLIDASNGGAVSFLDHTMRWDAGWYTSIINDLYQTNPASAAFYPLFPLLAGGLHFISFSLLDIPVSGQIINTISVYLAIVALLKIGKRLLQPHYQYWLVALFLSAPAAFFLHSFYGEAIFAAVSFWAYLFALKRNWMAVGILLAILTASRLPALLIIGLCGLEYLRSYGWSIKKSLNKKALWFLLAPVGFLAYTAYLFITKSNALAMFSAYDATTDWSYQVFNLNIFETIAKSGYQIIRAGIGLRPIDNELFVNILLPFTCLLLLGAASLYLIVKARGKYIPLGITGFISIIMFTLNSNIVSVHRYVLSCLALYIAVILIAKVKHGIILLIGCCLVGLITQMYLYYLFINTLFAG